VARKSVDIAFVLPRICPVLLSVVFDADLELLPTHVDAPCTYADLRLRPRQSRIDEDQARPRSLGRLGPAVHQPDYFAQLLQTSHACMALDQALDRRPPQPSRVRQCVHVDERHGAPGATSEVERGSRGCGQGYPANQLPFVAEQLVAASVDCRPDHGHAATARIAGVSSLPLGT
jgi:hypothetical protein